MTSDTIGICTWTLGIKDLDQLMLKISDLGLNGVQFCESYRDYKAEDVKNAANKYDLKLIIYDPFECGPGELNGEANRENALQYYKGAIDFASSLGVGQTLQGLSSWTKNCKDDAEASQFIVQCLQELDTYAKQKQVPLSYEPCNLYEVRYIHTAAEYQKLINISGCNNISILLDSFHMNIGESNPLEVIKKYAERNSVFHISDSNREGIAQGNIDFPAYCKALKEAKYEGPYVLEFVLKGNPVNTPPRNEEEMAELSKQIKESAKAWRSFLKAKNNNSKKGE